MRRPLLYGTLAVLLLAGAAMTASAEVARFNYKPGANVCGFGHTALKVGADGATGEWKPWLLSPVTRSYYCQPKATHMVTFRHPTTAQQVTVPIAFPVGTPDVAYQSNAILYRYTGYVIRVDFLPDGSVDVVYNSGLFRPLQ